MTLDPRDCYGAGSIKAIGLEQNNPGRLRDLPRPTASPGEATDNLFDGIAAAFAASKIREVEHGRDDRLPPPMTVKRENLPWARRERADGNLRRALAECEKLYEEDPRWARQYETLVEGLRAAVSMLDAIEDTETDIASRPGHSIKVRTVL